MLQTAAVFSNNMVLQRNKTIRVFGTADTGSHITVSLLGKEAHAVCRDGRWIAYLPEMEEAEDAVMEISDEKDHIRFTNIAIGEVWLAGGQSNMELELKDATGGNEILKTGLKNRQVLKKVRFYYTPKVAYEGDTLYEEEKKSHWELFHETDAAKWSAVGTFFAERLAEQTGVTVGIIGCNWGGTSASAWMSREALIEQEATYSYIEEYESSLWVQKSFEEQKKDYDEYLKYQEEWEIKASQIYESEPMMPFDEVQKLIGVCQYPGPVNEVNFTRPTGLYRSMLKRVAPYTIKGFLYYQGESDDHKPESYYALLTRLILQWREEFLDQSLPFLLVQLPMHRYQHDPDTKNWCIIREAQMKAYETVKNTGIAVAIDCGQFHEIHPKNKQPVGERLALQALSDVYGIIAKKDAFGPMYRDFLYWDTGKEKGMLLSFDYAQDGFSLREEVKGFEIAGGDHVFYPANAVFMLNSKQKNKVFIFSEKVKEPVMARYLWTNYGDVTVYGVNGLPMAPFRTHTDTER